MIQSLHTRSYFQDSNARITFPGTPVLYQGDNVRLLHDLSEPALPKHSEGRVTGIQRSPEGSPLAAEVSFYAGAKSITVALPFDAVELALAGAGGCTAVFWNLEKSPNLLIEHAMHAMLDRDFEMRQGPNVIRLTYERNGRFWKNGERITDPTGAHVVVSGPEWDGCIAAFSGLARYELEFRLGGNAPCVFLHQRWENYQQCRETTPPAMSLLRLLLNLYNAIGAECCAVPVASNWLVDESWNTLLQQPWFPDLFIVPQSNLPEQLPPLYRAGRLVNKKAILTALPVKFSPVDDPIERTERELKLNQLRACTAIGEKAYDQMYEAHGSVTGLYSDAKEAFYDAISIANELGLRDESEKLSKRLAHIKAVFRSQFT